MTFNLFLGYTINALLLIIDRHLIILSVYEVFMFLRKVLFVLVFSLGLTGCATMDKSECLNADWHMIGMEDGSRGYPLTQIGKHRKACSDYNITPVLRDYEDGYAVGIGQYCTENNGFRLGKSGGSYNGVCPPEVEAGFLIGYDAGKRLHATNVAVSKAAAAVKTNKDQLEKLKDDIKAKEALLVSSKTTEVARIRLLEEIRADEKKLQELEANTATLEEDQVEKQFEHDQLKNLNQY